MEIKKIDTSQTTAQKAVSRPLCFEDFVGQDQVKKILKTAIGSAQKRQGTLGHILFSGASGF